MFGLFLIRFVCNYINKVRSTQLSPHLSSH